MPITDDSTRLRALLAEIGMSQRAGARYLDIPSRDMRHYCAGSRDIPDFVFRRLNYLVGTYEPINPEKYC